MKIAVIGIGQSLRGDDAAGLEAVRRWQERHPETAGKPEIIAETRELPGLELLDLLGRVDAAVLVDAVCSSAPAGTIHRLNPDQLSAFAGGAQSAHGWGVAETLSMGRSLYPALAKCRVTLIGIAGGQFEMGAGLSPAVQAALGKAAAMIEKEVLAWLGE